AREAGDRTLRAPGFPSHAAGLLRPRLPRRPWHAHAAPAGRGAVVAPADGRNRRHAPRDRRLRPALGGQRRVALRPGVVVPRRGASFEALAAAAVAPLVAFAALQPAAGAVGTEHRAQAVV